MKTDKYSDQSGRTFVEVLSYIMVMISITVGFAAAVSRGFYKYELTFSHIYSPFFLYIIVMSNPSSSS